MGSVDLIAELGDSDYDAENTIFVAVGKDVEKCKTTLLWALQSFPGKKICLFHVHRPPNALSKPKQEMLGEFQELEKKKMFDVLNQYCHILAQEGVQADKVWIEMDNVEKGIVEIIAQYKIRWLVMGAAVDKHYSKKLTGLKSKKAVFVCQHAPISCHIWFSCKGCLVFTRESRIDRSEKEIALPLLLLNSDLETQQSEQLRLGSFTQTHRSLEKCTASGEDADDLEGISGSLNLQCVVHSSDSRNAGLTTSKLIRHAIEENRRRRLQLSPQGVDENMVPPGFGHSQRNFNSEGAGPSRYPFNPSTAACPFQTPEPVPSMQYANHPLPPISGKHGTWVEQTPPFFSYLAHDGQGGGSWQNRPIPAIPNFQMQFNPPDTEWVPRGSLEHYGEMLESFKHLMVAQSASSQWAADQLRGQIVHAQGTIESCQAQMLEMEGELARRQQCYNDSQNHFNAERASFVARQERTSQDLQELEKLNETLRNKLCAFETSNEEVEPEETGGWLAGIYLGNIPGVPSYMDQDLIIEE